MSALPRSVRYLIVFATIIIDCYAQDDRSYEDTVLKVSGQPQFVHASLPDSATPLIQRQSNIDTKPPTFEYISAKPTFEYINAKPTVDYINAKPSVDYISNPVRSFNYGTTYGYQQQGSQVGYQYIKRLNPLERYPLLQRYPQVQERLYYPTYNYQSYLYPQYIIPSYDYLLPFKK